MNTHGSLQGIGAGEPRWAQPDKQFGEFFNRHRVNIHGPKYQTYGTSKAKKMRAFWEQEPDVLVGKVLGEMLDAYEADCSLNNRDAEASVLEKSRGIVARLSGAPAPKKPAQTLDDFLHSEFSIPNIQKLPIEAQAVPIIESRLNEARTAMGAARIFPPSSYAAACWKPCFLERRKRSQRASTGLRPARRLPTAA